MTPSERPGHRLTRADLPEELTAETLRHLGFRTLRQLAHPGNGVLNADEQRQFDVALEDLKRDTAALVDSSLQRSRRGGPGNLDPEMRRSYARTQQRLAEQARRARQSFPELGEHLAPEPSEPEPDEPSAPEPDTSSDDDVSLGALEQEVEQTSDTLDMLEKIASIQQQQLEHQESQLLGETRGLFFAFVVSVSVIIAGVAPLVEAEPDDRLPIVLWTVATIVLAAVVYAVVRAAQNKK